MRGEARERRPVEIHAVAVGKPDWTDLSRDERLHPCRVVLGDEACGVNRVVEQNEHALPCRRRRRCDLDSVVEIQRTVTADRRPGTHRADHDHWLVGLHSELQEVRGFLQRAGSMCDNCARDVGARQRRIDSLHELQLQFGGHAAAADIADLRDIDLRQRLQLGQVVEQLFRRDAAVVVFGELLAMCALALDGAAGGEQGHRGKLARRSRERRRCQCSAAQDERKQCAGDQSELRGVNHDVYPADSSCWAAARQLASVRSASARVSWSRPSWWRGPGRWSARSIAAMASFTPAS